MGEFARMDDLTREVHYAAGREYGKEAVCEGKTQYAAEVNAVEEAARITTAKLPIEAYPCAYCDHWHVGRALSPREGARFLVAALGIEPRH